MSPPEDEEILN